ncbi:Putative niacin/nicotinamide transporter NaiP [Roseimaritima multifibrata]|uniref:Niacin/nicotinamide transporter NaiP n=1 Tax=Roseimaritima multifibrata TaxID=1930274 RepID=A0A517ML15_9BACT|nr:MFS transporter [Roseimaritima multifibrata]QDS95569.1 Putative niacin/nicotinamide transporter NaiP [Roseimaritima multifibrata]
MSNTTPKMEESSRAWYHGISRYQWMVLAVASLGWVFDAFEGQLFVACMRESLVELTPQLAALSAQLQEATDPQNAQVLRDEISSVSHFYENLGFAAFLVGGAVGGFGFGWISDRMGRSLTLMLTILTYSLFTGLTYFVTDLPQMLVLRFLAALGTGGEWAVASAMVAETFPPRARARAASIFHGSSTFGTMIAAAIGAFVVANPDLGWRPAFLIGALPALLVVLIRVRLHDSPERKEAEDSHQAASATHTKSAWREPGVLKNLLLGILLATVGLSTFWGVHVYGRQAYLKSVEAAHPEWVAVDSEDGKQTLKRQEMLGMWLVTVGGGLGLFSFGPICEWVGRRKAFIGFHVAATVVSVILFTFLKNATPWPIGIWLPVFGFFTLGMHAGYAVYFPELFPSRIRGAASGICFNCARITAAPALILSGTLIRNGDPGQFYVVTSCFSLLFLVGAVIVLFGPETKGQALPE